MPAARKSSRNNAAKAGAMLLAAIGIGIWAMADRPGQDQPSAACAAARPADPPSYAALCAALNRPDLPALLGTPQGQVSAAGPAPLAFGPDAVAEVHVGLSVVALTDSSVTVEDIAGMPEFHPRPTTVLGHGALTYTTSTVTLGAGGSPQTLFVHDLPGATPSPASEDDKTSPGSGAPVRRLVVAQDPKGPGGRAFEIAIFRTNGEPVDDALLHQVAEAVMPTLPGWVATPSDPSRSASAASQ
ncbi:DUF6215 domain-containing protein [Kitasatospora sp. NPDC051705]|uniref:DUF6215 domain-containing protein n=1 Tax=Kitasatospora sp. NPDC051705 TaxID=3364057 RepID=UPI0037BDFFD8